MRTRGARLGSSRCRSENGVTDSGQAAVHLKKLAFETVEALESTLSRDNRDKPAKLAIARSRGQNGKLLRQSNGGPRRFVALIPRGRRFGDCPMLEVDRPWQYGGSTDLVISADLVVTGLSQQVQQASPAERVSSISRAWAREVSFRAKRSCLT